MLAQLLFSGVPVNHSCMINQRRGNGKRGAKAYTPHTTSSPQRYAKILPSLLWKGWRIPSHTSSSSSSSSSSLPWLILAVCVCKNTCVYMPIKNYHVLVLAVHFALTREYISMAEARNILGFGGYQHTAHTKKDTKGGDMECALERERGPGCEWESPLLLLLLAFWGSGQEAKKIPLSLSLSRSLYPHTHSLYDTTRGREREEEKGVCESIWMVHRIPCAIIRVGRFLGAVFRYKTPIPAFSRDSLSVRTSVVV